MPFGSDYLPSSDGVTIGTQRIAFRAMRTAGTGNLRVDGFLIIPLALDEPGSRDTWLLLESGQTQAGYTVRIDSRNERIVTFDPAASNNFKAAFTPTATSSTGPHRIVGAFPKVRPGGENRLRLIPFGGKGAVPTTESVAYAFNYQPAYLHVRPSGS